MSDAFIYRPGQSSPALLDKLKLRVVAMYIRLGNSLLNFSRRLLYHRLKNEPRRVLVFRTGSLGDSVCALPAIRSIRGTFPHARLDILTNAGRKSLVGLGLLLNPADYDNVIDYFEFDRKQLMKVLKQNEYDLVVQLPQVDAPLFSLLRDLIVFRMVAPMGMGWQLSQCKLFRKTQSRYIQFKDERTRLLELLGRNGIKPPTGDRELLNLTDRDVENAKQTLSQLGLLPADKLIAIVTGAKRPQNRWPIEYFRKVILHFSGAYKVLLIGGKEDSELVAPLLSLPGVYNACGLLSPIESAAAIKLCQLTISNDTGPMHLSYTVGVPTIALFSSRDLPGKWYPPANAKNYVFRTTGIHCEGCFSEVCNDNICMKAISPEEVIAVAEELLARTTSPVAII